MKDLATRIIGLIFLGLVSVAPLSANEGCTVNCVAQEKVGDKLLITWFGHEGEKIKVFTADIPFGAQIVTGSKELNGVLSLDDNLMNKTDGGGTVDIKQHTYETSTHVVVVTTIMFFDANGNLLDVQVNVNSFSKNQIK